MTRNILKLTDFICSFLVELSNIIVVVLYILNNLVPEVLPSILKTILENNILFLFIPILTNSITLLYVYHLKVRTKKEIQVRIIVGSTVRRMKYQIPTLLLIDNFVAVIGICIAMLFSYSLLNKFYLIFIITIMLRLSIIVILTFIEY